MYGGYIFFGNLSFISVEILGFFVFLILVYIDGIKMDVSYIWLKRKVS